MKKLLFFLCILLLFSCSACQSENRDGLTRSSNTYDEGYAAGYAAGWSDGYGYVHDTEFYDLYSEGRVEGYVEGYRDAAEGAAPLYQ